MNSEGMLSDNPKAGIHPTDVARTVSTNGGNPGNWQGGDVIVGHSFSVDCRNMYVNQEKSGTLQAKNEGGFSLNFINPVIYDNTSSTLQTGYHYGRGGDDALVIENHPADSRVDFARDNVVPTLTARIGTGGGNVPMILEKEVTYIQPSFGEFREDDVAQTLKASDGKRVDPGAFVLEEREAERKYIVRRLTPTECGRLQGFPDGWTDGANGSDTAIYKMWGNGIALPCAVDVMGRIAKELKKGEIE